LTAPTAADRSGSSPVDGELQKCAEFGDFCVQMNFSESTKVARHGDNRRRKIASRMMRSLEKY